MTKRVLPGLAIGIAVGLGLLFHFRSDPGLSGIRPVREIREDSQKPEVDPKGFEQTSRLKESRRFVPPWERKIEKRAAAKIDSSQLVWLGEGWRLVDDGEFLDARRKFQTLINEHGGELAKYALVAISEAFLLEGGEENLRAAQAGFRDFLVFYPDHELAAHARVRLMELRQTLPPKRVPVDTR